MKILFLGTGTSTGVPHIGCNCKVCTSSNPKDARLRSSVLFSLDGLNILLDCGPDFRQQALKYKLSKTDGIILTHEHYDHVAGIDELRPMCEADVYGERRVIEILKENRPYIFSPIPYPGAPDIRLHEIEDFWMPFHIKHVPVMPVRLQHFNLPILGYRIENTAYLTDFNEIDESEYSKLQGLDVLILDALRQHAHHAHLMLSEALELVNKLNPKRAYFTHVSHDMGLFDEVQDELPENVFLAYDGLEIEE